MPSAVYITFLYGCSTWPGGVPTRNLHRRSCADCVLNGDTTGVSIDEVAHSDITDSVPERVYEDHSLTSIS